MKSSGIPCYIYIYVLVDVLNVNYQKPSSYQNISVRKLLLELSNFTKSLFLTQQLATKIGCTVLSMCFFPSLNENPT